MKVSEEEDKRSLRVRRRDFIDLLCWGLGAVHNILLSVPHRIIVRDKLFSYLDVEGARLWKKS